jgi:hypothetical protein
LADLTVHRLSNTHPNGLPHWAELLETVGVASYEAPEAILSRLNCIIDKGRIFIITVDHIWRLCAVAKAGFYYEADKESKLI